MKKEIFLSVVLFLVAAFFLIVPLHAADDGYLSVNVAATVKTSDPDKCGDSIIKWIEDNGGYFTVKSKQILIVRFPSDSLHGFKSFLTEVGDDLISYSSSSSDMREKILNAQSGIKAREEMLAQNMALVGRADFEGILYLEQEILRLMTELDELKGLLRKAGNDREMVYGEININFKQQDLPDMGASSFAWMNNVDFASLLNDRFRKPGGINFSLSGKVPEGFAFMGSGKSLYRAISPEGVRFQIRKTKNRPRKSVEFWQESFIRQMELRGYTRVGKIESVETVRGKGFLISWGLSYGAADYLYITGVVIEKGKLYIVECAGEYDTVKRYRKSIDTFLKEFKW